MSGVDCCIYHSCTAIPFALVPIQFIYIHMHVHKRSAVMCARTIIQYKTTRKTNMHEPSAAVLWPGYKKLNCQGLHCN